MVVTFCKPRRVPLHCVRDRQPPCLVEPLSAQKIPWRVEHLLATAFWDDLLEHLDLPCQPRYAQQLVRSTRSRFDPKQNLQGIQVHQASPWCGSDAFAELPQATA
eukprot:SAG31_NODE_31906_length_362_cov_1.159696_1_plen_104_part_10